MSSTRASQAYQEVSDRADRDQLIMAHIGFVRHVVRRTVATLPDDVDLENLESAGMLGLVEASQRYDEMRGVDFRTFAHPRVRGAVLDELRRNCPLSKQMLRKVALVRKTSEHLQPPATPEDIAAQSGLTISEVEDCLEAMRLTRPKEIDDQSAVTGIPRFAARGPDATAEFKETQQILADCIEELPEQERTVLTLYHLEDLRLKEIGEVMGLSESRISRVLAKAEFRLGEAVKARGG